MKTMLVALVAVLGLTVCAYAEEPKKPTEKPESLTTAPAVEKPAPAERPTKETPATTAPAKKVVPKDKPAVATVGAKPRVAVETTLGTITLELDADKAPITVANFLQYVEEGFYKGTVFHRVIPSFMIQGGGYTRKLDEKVNGLRNPIKSESKNGLKNARGTIAMARTSDPDSATSQFFINVVDNPKLDYPKPDGHGYTVFGNVVEGMDVVDAIRDTPTRTDAKYSDGKVVPVEPVVITSVRVLEADKGGAKPPTKPATGVKQRKADEAAEAADTK